MCSIGVIGYSGTFWLPEILVNVCLRMLAGDREPRGVPIRFMFLMG